MRYHIRDLERSSERPRMSTPMHRSITHRQHALGLLAPRFARWTVELTHSVRRSNSSRDQARPHRAVQNIGTQRFMRGSSIQSHVLVVLHVLVWVAQRIETAAYRWQGL